MNDLRRRSQGHLGRPSSGSCRQGTVWPDHPHRTTTAARHDARLAWRVRKLPTAEGDEDARTTELSNEDLQTVLGLIKDADSVELKLTIHESARADAARALGVDPLDSQIRQVFFFDTPDPALNAAGVVVRARRRQNEQGDTVVKLRPVVPNELAEEMRASKSFNVEVDAMPGGSCAPRRSRAWRTTAPSVRRPRGIGRSASSSRSSASSTRTTHRTEWSSTRSRSSARSRSSR